jgi:hypothetical protein
LRNDAGVDLAKPALDVGLYTDHVDASLAFWRDEIGLPYEELLKAGGGIHQHRLTLHGAVLKVNASREPLPEEPSGLAGLRIAHGGGPAAMQSPEGVEVELVRPGHDGIDAVEIRTVTAAGEAARRWWIDGLGCDAIGDGRFRLGETVIAVAAEPSLARTGPMRARGFRYLTVQIRDLEGEHRRLLDLGFDEGTAPIRLGDVAYISFIRSPDGDWLELSQRRSLTGPLPEGARAR